MTDNELNERVARLEGWVRTRGSSMYRHPDHIALRSQENIDYCNDPRLWWPIAERLIRDDYDFKLGPQSDEYAENSNTWSCWWMQHYEEGDVRPHESSPGS